MLRAPVPPSLSEVLLASTEYVKMPEQGAHGFQRQSPMPVIRLSTATSRRPFSDMAGIANFEMQCECTQT